MSEPFLAEVRMFGFNFAPQSWAFCNGQIMPIAQNAALFSLIGTNFGGNGTTNFALPNLQGSLVVGTGQNPARQNYVIGATGGQTTVTLSAAQMPTHTHTVNTMSDPATVNVPAVDVVLARAVGGNAYNSTATPNPAAMAPQALNTFGSPSPQLHTNLMPTLTVNFCIALSGVFPPRP